MNCKFLFSTKMKVNCQKHYPKHFWAMRRDNDSNWIVDGDGNKWLFVHIYSYYIGTLIKVLVKVCYRQNFKRDICAWELGITIQICIVWHGSNSKNKKIDQLFRFRGLTNKNTECSGQIGLFILRQTAPILAHFVLRFHFPCRK